MPAGRFLLLETPLAEDTEIELPPEIAHQARDVLRLGALAQPKRLALFHHDPDRTDEALDKLGENARAWLKEHAPAVEAVVASEGQAFTLPGG